MLLGPPRVERDGATVAFDTRKAVALLAVLALADRPRPRDVLADLLWPEHDAEHARGALRRTLSALRSARRRRLRWTRRATASALVRGAGLRGRRRRFRAAAAEGRLRGRGRRGVPRRLPRGLRAARRAGVRGLAARRGRRAAARAGARAGAAGRGSRATWRCARRWLELDPLHEPAHRALIRLYAEQGDRAAALAQYRECVRTLSRELGVPPLDGDDARSTRRSARARWRRPPPRRRWPRRRCRRAPLVGRERRVGGAARRLRRHRAATAASCCSRARRGSARRGWPRSWWRTPASAGAAVLGGRAYEEEAALAYGPLVEALRGRLREDDALGGGGRASARSARRRGCSGDLSAVLSPAARRAGRAGALPRRRVGDARRRGGRAGAGRAARSTTCSGPTRRRSGCSPTGCGGSAGRRCSSCSPRASRCGGSAGRRIELGAPRARDEVGELLAAAGGPEDGSPTGSTRRPRGCRSCSSSTSTRSAPTRTGRCPRARASCCWRAWSR